MGQGLFLDHSACDSPDEIRKVLEQLSGHSEIPMHTEETADLQERIAQWAACFDVPLTKSECAELAAGLYDLAITELAAAKITPLIQTIRLALGGVLPPDDAQKAEHGFLFTGQAAEKDQICQLECNIDDCTGEMLGLAMERLFAAGARDVRFAPVFMKKNRPAYELKVICTPKQVQDMERLIFENTTTIGIRRQFLERSVLKRHSYDAETSLGCVQVKACEYPDGVRIYPEYESVKKICQEKNMSYDEAYVRIRGDLLQEK